jgi:hypothetical protein
MSNRRGGAAVFRELHVHEKGVERLKSGIRDLRHRFAGKRTQNGACGEVAADPDRHLALAAVDNRQELESGKTNGGIRVRDSVPDGWKDAPVKEELHNAIRNGARKQNEGRDAARRVSVRDTIIVTDRAARVRQRHACRSTIHGFTEKMHEVLNLIVQNLRILGEKQHYQVHSADSHFVRKSTSSSRFETKKEIIRNAVISNETRSVDFKEVFALFLSSGDQKSGRYCFHFSNLSLLLCNSFDSNEDQSLTYTINFSIAFSQPRTNECN